MYASESEKQNSYLLLNCKLLVNSVVNTMFLLVSFLI